MSYTIKVTTEMLRAPNSVLYTLAENLPAGDYILTGSGRYSLDNGNSWYNYNQGEYAYYANTILIFAPFNGQKPDTHGVSRLFGTSTEARFYLPNNGWVKLWLNEVFGKTGKEISDGLEYTLRGANEPLPYICAKGTRVLYGGTLRKDPIGLQLISSNQIHAPFTALLEINGTQYTITDGTYVDIPISGQTNGKVGVFDIGASGACIDIIITTGEPPPVVVPVLPLFPSDPGCTLPTLSWNFIEVMKGLIEWVVCHINHIIMILGWFKDVIVSAFDYVMQFMLYFLSMKWLTDFIAKFFDALDTWLSAKFGIEKEKPFLDELMKKFMSWLLSFLDSAAENDKKNW